ncbi:MAG: MqnA/MqnD/SBP family protein [Planctomycetota bacterium]
MTSPTTANKTLRIGHSPDPDDAFMWWPLANFVAPDGTQLKPQIDTRGYDFVHVLEDIQSLNERSEKGELEITAFSIHQYPHVAEHYALTSCGSSMGDGYGPMIVSRPGVITKPQDLKGKKLAMPGPRTTAWLSTQLWLHEHGMSQADFEWEHVMFDEILNLVEAETFDAGLIIHEGQITFQDQGLELVVDLGTWWTDSRKLPLPLGGNAIRRDLVESGEAPLICRVLLDSIQHALDHREEAVAFALNYARNMGSELADRFVGMYVNQWTMDYGDRGRAAVSQLMKEGVAAGLIPALPGDGEVDFVDPA